MKYNFDKVIDRSGTSAEKVEGLKHIWGRTDLIPLWVADMDFATAPFVTDAIRKRCENEVNNKLEAIKKQRGDKEKKQRQNDTGIVEQ